MTAVATSLLKRTAAAVESLRTFVETTPFRDRLASDMDLLANSVAGTCSVAVAGQVKTGKSSFINALLGEDLALVGTTETTATVNHFRFGKPPDPDLPVRCVWADGRATWEHRAFLDSLQGHSTAAIERATKISELEYWLENPVLSRVEIVDTPGTNASVHDDAHEIRTAEYFAFSQILRERHDEQTRRLSAKADAVIYLSNGLVKSEDAEFLSQFQKNTGGGGLSATAGNMLLVMSRADEIGALTGSEGTRKRYLMEESEQLSRQLERPVRAFHVSAHLFRIASGHDPAFWDALGTECKAAFPDTDTLDAFLDGTDSDFCAEDPDLDDFMPRARRKEIVSSLGPFSWNVKKIALRTAFASNGGNEIRQNLLRMSGFAEVREALESKFFSRSEALRCDTVVTNCLQLLEFLRRDIAPDYDDAVRQTMADCAGPFMRYVVTHPDFDSSDDQSTGRRLQRFLRDNAPKPFRASQFHAGLDAVERAFASLKRDVDAERDRCESLFAVQENSECFSEAERTELTALFKEGKPADSRWCVARAVHWRVQAQRAMSPNRKVVCQTAERIYSGE